MFLTWKDSLMRINIKAASIRGTLLGAVLTAISCSQWQVTNPNSPYFMPLPGAKITVHKRLEVTPGETRVFFQYGKLIPKRSLFEYDVNCQLEIKKLADTVLYIEPGTYTITRTRRQEEFIVVDNVNDKFPVRLASLGVQFSGLPDHDGSSMMFEVIRMRLQGEQHSNLRELACRGALAEPVNMKMPTLSEMRKALGDYVSIEVPQENATRD
jgi:hypothetical protein